MNQRTGIQFALLALLGPALPASAQSLRFQGLENSPLGNASLSEDANGHLLVSNLGSSGLDGVRVALDHSQGCRLAPSMDLGTNGHCSLRAEALRDGAPAPVPVQIDVTSDGTGTYWQPDYSGLGQQTYTLHVYNQGQLVFDESGLGGPTKMQSGTGLNAMPMEAYILTNPFGPWGGAFLTCLGDEGGTIVTPPGGTPLQGDFVEFLSQPAQITQVVALEVLTRSLPSFTLEAESLRLFQHWVSGLVDAHLDARASGGLRVSNLGSSGQDGVSIDLGSGASEVQAQLSGHITPGENGGIIKLESQVGSGELDGVSAQESAGDWSFTPDFSQLGSQTYTLELYEQGQLVFQQSGMSGPAVTTAAWALFYKKTTQHPDGSTTSEWCIGGSASSAHHVAGGPTIQADMFTLRSEASILTDSSLRRLAVRANDVVGEFDLDSVTLPAPCVGTSYCQTSPNSVGSGALMCSTGSASVAANDLVLVCSGLPVNQFGIFFYGPNQIQAAFGNGFRCVGGSTQRLPVLSSRGTGTLSYALDNTNPPSASGQISAGQQWNFQCWYRDPAGGGSSFNLSDGHAVLFLP